jgi:hypothetical protein
MGTMTLRLIVDPSTRKKTIFVKYDSDSDATAYEHEEEHKRLVKSLLASGLISADDVDSINIEREGQGSVDNKTNSLSEQKREAIKV